MPYTDFARGSRLLKTPRRQSEEQAEITRLENELRAFVAIALQHGMRDYCEIRHPDLTRELEEGLERARHRAEVKYAYVMERLARVPGLMASTGETGERTYYRNSEENVAYIEHSLWSKRFILSGIWVAPKYRGEGVAHRILRQLVEAADEAELGIELHHEPFGEEGLDKPALEAFYNRHGFQHHELTPGAMFRIPRSPLDHHGAS
ncbi:GNAT family N-acetyltransferase [Alloyangia pacifica]|uniref:Acetyltransferase (GNAT) domain-containing protein n=1 Tax=Alloyangia pacifica TaxID=311180 RepID=A0A1I6T1X8_9RHOB|nr:GNAT family N-acetyltransferase [Alloyangia pacifica]SDG94428.1 Acetyltransferase (GNAT) domain-containing protein [Alloyangia pacifica]SFS83166.1 Acetyltransferase (GNAT) domain-containing protein [Alloyangia pacifica]